MSDSGAFETVRRSESKKRREESSLKKKKRNKEREEETEFMTAETDTARKNFFFFRSEFTTVPFFFTHACFGKSGKALIRVFRPARDHKTAVTPAKV